MSYYEDNKREMLKMKTIFTERNMYTLIDIWYSHDEIFTLIARGLVKTHLANGLNLDTDFIYELLDIDERWCCKVGV